MLSLQREVDQLAVRNARARAEYDRLGDQVSRIERELRTLEAAMGPVRQVTTRRVISVYEAAGPRLLPALSAKGALEAERAAHLAGSISARNLAELRRLTNAADEVKGRRDELSQRRQERQAALMRLEEESRRVEERLTELGRAQRRLEAEAETRARRSSQRASQRASRSAPAAPRPPDLARDFICPLLGPVAFTDDWGDPRSGGRRHQGTDILARRGSENVAVVPGTVNFKRSRAGGLSAYLEGDNGHEYYYAHLESTVGEPRRVAQGEVIGLTGNSGNARGGPTHTHFEIHPGKGRPVNPYQILRQHC